jgi:hypothetical protein
MNAGLTLDGQLDAAERVAERRVAERRAIIHAHLELALEAVRERLESGWLGQEYSPLGRERHVEAVRARLAAGHRDAAIEGRRYLLTIDAVVEECFGALGRATPANDNGGCRW